MNELIIKRGQVVFVKEGKINQGEILVKDHLIAKVDQEISFSPVRTINASNLFVTPGFIDLQVNGGGKVDKNYKDQHVFTICKEIARKA